METSKSRPVSDFDFLRISVAGPDRVRSWSFGEVRKPETINYRTFKPERDGLFCSRIFGPVRDYECLCGKYKRMKFRGIVCEKCGVEVTLSNVRRDRMGHIELAAPVAHIWFIKIMPSKVSTILDIPLRDLEKILYFESYIVLDPGETELKAYQLITEEEFVDIQDQFGESSFKALIGAEAIKQMLASMDLLDHQKRLRNELTSSPLEMRRRKIVKRLKLVEAFLESGDRPEWMILDVLPVIPPDLRPLVPLDGGRFATSDLNDLYRRVINRNNRLRRLLDLKAPDIILRNEKRMLQEAVDALFDNSRRSRPITGSNKRPLKSLADMLRGKHGRFRQNLLGKRVDYSGRSVIVVGPNLKLHQCGLPKRMALELFKPFVYSKLERSGLAMTVKAAKRMVDRERPEVWDILEEVIHKHPVLLNRAPTLHRLGIQAFDPVLIEGKAIQLHPLVCAAFNADFDGDQMAVHVPLSIEAQLEVRVLMMSTNNILSPASGKPIINPTKDIVLGLYYLTSVLEDQRGEERVFLNVGEIEHALEAGIVSLQSRIKARLKILDENRISRSRIVETTPGRMILFDVFPQHPSLPFELVNQQLTSKKISDLIDKVYRYCGQEVTVTFTDRITMLGFSYATRSAVSFGKDDLIVPSEKQKYVSETQQVVKKYEQQYLDGLLTRNETYNKVVDAWSQCSEKVAQSMMQGLETIEDGRRVNSIYMMVQSGARGSEAQMRQLAGMRGLMTKPSGEIIEIPVISNFKEGLTVLEYFNSTHGARKGLSDTALKTANSGYLTRRLVDVAQDVVVRESDCRTTSGISVQAIIKGGEIFISLYERVLGRTALDDILDPRDNKLISSSSQILDEKAASWIEQAGISSVRVRSVLTCEAEVGVCSACYGRDLARGTQVSVGESVGIIAAQSIGEPGTQLTMRTFHIGGAAQGPREKSCIEASFNGKVSIDNINPVRNSQGILVVMSRHGVLTIEGELEKVDHKVPYGSRLLLSEVDQVSFVVHGQKLVEWDPFTFPILTDAGGTCHFVDLEEGISIREEVDEATGVSSRAIIDWQQQAGGRYLKPRVFIQRESDIQDSLSKAGQACYLLPIDAVLNVNEGDLVKSGDVLARVPRGTSRTRDITGGLPRVVELFEARTPTDPAVICEIDGQVEFGKDYKSKRRILVVPREGEEEATEYLVPSGRRVTVFDGDLVKRGDILVDGIPSLRDILQIMGIEALAQYLLNEVQEVYHLQGVKINDKHIEVIVRQMLQKVKIDDPGDSMLLVGEHVDRKELIRINKTLVSQEKRPASGKPVLYGITKASLQTSSFFSAASFQETTRVLTEAAVMGKIDPLVGLKESVIVGRLIPSGTGKIVNDLKVLSQGPVPKGTLEELGGRPINGDGETGKVMLACQP